MARARKSRLAVTRDDQREALTSTVRMEILEHLLVVGPATVATLAERMGRTPHSLYHHVRRLVAADLVVQTDTRRSGRRDQALYDAVADTIETPVQPGPDQDHTWEAKAIAATFRCAEREFLDALASGRVDANGRDWFVGRLNARLSRGARREVMQHLRAINRVFTHALRADHDPRARLENCSLTAAFVPSRPPPDG